MGGGGGGGELETKGGGRIEENIFFLLKVMLMHVNKHTHLYFFSFLYLFYKVFFIFLENSRKLIATPHPLSGVHQWAGLSEIYIHIYIHVCETGHNDYKFGLIHLQVCLAKVIDILNIEHVHVYTLSHAV